MLGDTGFGFGFGEDGGCFGLDFGVDSDLLAAVANRDGCLLLPEEEAQASNRCTPVLRWAKPPALNTG
jgi:hypothetical protein